MESTTEAWDPSAAGVMRLPSGRLIRGRGLRNPLPSGQRPTYGVYLLGKAPPAVPWRSTWLTWPDFWLPGDPAHTTETLHEAWSIAESERVEVACGGGRGRTGTALAVIAVLDGVSHDEAVAYVRKHYDRHAVETPWQKRFVRNWRTSRR